MEIWKPVIGFESLYEVSNYGRIRALDKIVDRSTKGKFLSKGRLLTPCDRGNGYLRVCVRVRNKQTTFAIHREVAKIFLPEPLPERIHVNHIDGDKTNNHVSNLEWVTAKENKEHAVKFGLVGLGERNGNASLTAKKIKLIRKQYESNRFTQYELADKHGIRQSHVSRIIRRETWSHV